MNGLSQQTRLVAGFSALAIHVAIGAHLLLVSPSAHGGHKADSTGVLVVELLPLTADPDWSVNSPAPRGAVDTIVIKPRLSHDANLGKPDGDVQDAAFMASAGRREVLASASLPSASGDGRSAAAFQHDLLAHIERFRHYPARARRDGVEGVAVLSFAMDRNGKLVEAWVEHSSGSVMLDAEALSAIQRSQPLPPIPPDMPDRLVLVLPISFSLN